MESASGQEIRVIQEVATEWKKVALALGYEQARIGIIEKDNRMTEEACQEMFAKWLNGARDLATPRTWNTLIRCLNQAGLVRVATSLKETLERKGRY